MYQHQHRPARAPIPFRPRPVTPAPKPTGQTYLPHEWPAAIARIRARDPELAAMLVGDIGDLIAAAEEARPDDGTVA